MTFCPRAGLLYVNLSAKVKEVKVQQRIVIAQPLVSVNQLLERNVIGLPGNPNLIDEPIPVRTNRQGRFQTKGASRLNDALSCKTGLAINNPDLSFFKKTERLPTLFLRSFFYKIIVNLSSYLVYRYDYKNSLNVSFFTLCKMEKKEDEQTGQ